MTKTCPKNETKGKKVKSITLKSLLKPSALENLNPDTTYYFCEASDCPVVYFNEKGQSFSEEQIKEPVFQKDKGGWQRFVN